MSLINLPSASGVLNVAGSIGGLANAVSNLFGPAAGSWQASLQTASFGGVKFGVNAATTRGGRRNAVHTYPYRDEIWVEDQGKLPRKFQIHGFLIENSLIYGGGGVVAQRQAMLEVCETAGPQTLVHPTFGTVKNVNCLDFEINERKDLGKVFEFSLTLVVSGAQKYPTTTTSTTDALTTAASALRAQSLLDYAKTAIAAIQKGAAVVQQVVSTAVGYYQMAVGFVNSINQIFNAVTGLVGNFGSLFGGANSGYTGSNLSPGGSSATVESLLAENVAATAAVSAAGASLITAAANPSDTATYGAAAGALVDAIVAAAQNPADAITALSSLATYAPSSASSASSAGAPVYESIAIANDASTALLRRTAISGLATVVGSYQPSSQDDAQNLLNNVVSLIDVEILTAADAGDDNSYAALQTIRSAVTADLQARGANLASIATFSFMASQPALSLANRIYRDPSRVGQLIQQVAPVHPAFMPTSFQALSQ